MELRIDHYSTSMPFIKSGHNIKSGTSKNNQDVQVITDQVRREHPTCAPQGRNPRAVARRKHTSLYAPNHIYTWRGKVPPNFPPTHVPYWWCPLGVFKSLLNYTPPPPTTAACSRDPVRLCRRA
eukprot:scaffold8615_cov61-Phaeocystis_antarctica.AAC.2